MGVKEETKGSPEKMNVVQLQEEFFAYVSTGNLDKVKRVFLPNKGIIDTLKQDLANQTNVEGNTILHIAVGRQDEAMIDLLVEDEHLRTYFKAGTLYDVLLHAVKENSLSIVKKIENIIKERMYPALAYLPENDKFVNSKYSRDITPIMLAAQTGSYELIRHFDMKGDKIEPPKSRMLVEDGKDEFERCYLRLHTYQAICNPVYICYQAAKDSEISRDPIYDAFKLANELEGVIDEEPEFRAEYDELIAGLKQFTCDLLEQCRDSKEVKMLLEQKKGFEGSSEELYPRIALAIQWEQKPFVGHPFAQMVLYDEWAGGDLPKWGSGSSFINMANTIVRIFLLPILALIIVFAQPPFLASPLSRCRNSMASYIIFLLMVLYVSMNKRPQNERSPPITYVEIPIMFWVLGHCVSMFRQIFVARSLFWSTYWNVYDFITQTLWIATFISWGIAWHHSMEVGNILNRERWPWYEPILIAECFFSLASILSVTRVLRVLLLNHTLGPLINALGKMARDIMDMLLFFIIMMLSFTVGLYYMYRPYEGWEDEQYGKQNQAFCTLWQSFQTLFWALFTMSGSDSGNIIKRVVADPANPTVTAVNHLQYTHWIGKGIFKVYHVLAPLMLINMMLAVMSNTYEQIATSDASDAEWKFARTQIWLAFARDTANPSPFNLIPTLPFCLSNFVGQKRRREKSSEQNEYSILISKLIYRYFREKADASSAQPASGEHLEKLKGELDELKQYMQFDERVSK